MSERSAPVTKWPIIGHDRVVTFLQQTLVNQTVNHAYLFFGQDHVGRKTVAAHFTNALLCLESSAGQSAACGVCAACQQLAHRSHPDVTWVGLETDEKTTRKKTVISIEQIRQLQQRLNLHAFFNHYKVAVITQAERLTTEAANALLKTLEEPTKKTTLILIASSLTSIPATIISRCQVLKFLPATQQQLIEYLATQSIEPAKATAIAAQAAGLPGMAIRYHQTPALLDEQQQTVAAFNRLHLASPLERLRLASAGLESAEAKKLLSSWTAILRDILLIKSGNQALASNQHSITTLTQMSQLYPVRLLLSVLGGITLAQQYVSANVSPRLALENVLLDLPTQPSNKRL